LRQERHSLSALRRAELDKFGAACRARPELRGVVQTLFDVMLPRGKSESANDQSLAALLDDHGFDRVQHENVRVDLKEGRIGLAQNRLPTSAVIEDVSGEDVVDARKWLPAPKAHEVGFAAMRKGEIAVVTLAAGPGVGGRKGRRGESLAPVLQTGRASSHLH